MPTTTSGSQLDGLRRIGPIGTWSRAAVGVGLVMVGFLGTIRPSGAIWYEPVLGLVALPLLTVLFAVIAGHYRTSPLRLTGPLATGVNCLVIVGLASDHITGPTVELFYGATLLVAAWRGQPGCEATVIPNTLLDRDDQIGCPLFSPIDHAERRGRVSPQRVDGRRAGQGTSGREEPSEGFKPNNSSSEGPGPALEVPVRGGVTPPGASEVATRRRAEAAALKRVL